MTKKLNKKNDKLDSIFCDRCNTIYRKIIVSKKVTMPMCPLCHMELFAYFIDDDSKFIHFGNWDLFAEISEKIENNTSKLGFVSKETFARHRSGLTYTEFVNVIRDRTRKMSLMEQKFEPLTDAKRRSLRAQKSKGGAK